MPRESLRDLDLALERNIGWMAPCVLRPSGKDFTLLLGERRWHARRLGGSTKIAVHVVRTWEQVRAWMLLDATDPAPRKPTRLDEVAALRMVILELLDMNRHQKIDCDAVLEHVYAFSQRHIREMCFVARKVQQHRDDAALVAFAMEQLYEAGDGRISASAAGDRLRKYIENGQRAQKALPAFRQAETLDKISAQLDGIVNALQTLGPLAPTLERGARTRWETSLVKAKGQLTKMLREIRGETE